MMGSARFARRVLLVVAIFLKHTTALSLGEPGSISVCTNRACRKAGSHDTLRLLRSLASTAARCNMFDDELSVGHTEPDACATESDMTSLISSCGCLGNCGMGPNVHGTKTDEVFRDVYKPKSARALLEAELGLEVSDDAVKASVHRLYAERAMRAGNLDEAMALLTTALNTCGPLRLQGAVLLAQLLNLRADVYELKRDPASANADRERAEDLLKRRAAEMALSNGGLRVQFEREASA